MRKLYPIKIPITVLKPFSSGAANHTSIANEIIPIAKRQKINGLTNDFTNCLNQNGAQSCSTSFKPNFEIRFSAVACEIPSLELSINVSIRVVSWWLSILIFTCLLPLISPIAWLLNKRLMCVF